MTLEEYIQNINTAYKRGTVLDAIHCVDIDQLKKSIVADVTVGKNKTGVKESNLSLEIVNQIVKRFGLTFVPEKENGNLCFVNNNEELRDEFVQSFSPIDVLDYLYVILHSSTYRKVHKDSLKIDFSKIPYPKTISGFRTLTVLGSELRQIHLLQSPKVNLTETDRLMKVIDAIDTTDSETKI